MTVSVCVVYVSGYCWRNDFVWVQMYIPPEIHFRDINMEEDIMGCGCVLVSGRGDTYITLQRICFNFHYSLPHYISWIVADAHIL